MYVEEILDEHLKGNIRAGDTVTFTGLWIGTSFSFQAPYYYCQEEQYSYRNDLLTDELKSFIISTHPVNDMLGPHYNASHFLCPLDMNHEILRNGFSSNRCKAIHFISYGLDLALGEFVKYSMSSEPLLCDLFTVTGKIIEPKNSNEIPVALGVGFFEYLRFNMIGEPLDVNETLNQSFYDGRPVVDLTRFSEDFQKIKIQHVLNRTGMKYGDFQWVLKNEDDQLEPGDFWIKSERLREMIDGFNGNAE